jgi:hypothetical protein
MKKIVCIIAVVLMIASVVYAAKKAGITAKDLPGMKGMWTGMMSFGEFEGGGSSACTLEILNDTAPVKAKLTISQVPNVIASQLGIPAGQNVMESADGTLTSMGTIMWTGQAKNFVELSKSGDKIKLYYWYMGLRGNATLKKK